MPKSTVAALAWQYGVELDDPDDEKRTPRQLEQAEHEHRFSIMEKGPVQTETDVLEVWFAGCHCGMSLHAYGSSIYQTDKSRPLPLQTWAAGQFPTTHVTASPVSPCAG